MSMNTQISAIEAILLLLFGFPLKTIQGETLLICLLSRKTRKRSAQNQHRRKLCEEIYFVKDTARLKNVLFKIFYKSLSIRGKFTSVMNKKPRIQIR